jgi:bisphosphoglycerate-dependent phosphoglycerate mutase
MIHRRRDAVSEVPHTRSKLRTILLSVVGAFLAFALATPVANAAEVMRVTFVRHGQSYGNVSGNIDTKVPGPVLTPLGQQQAQDIVKVLGDNNYDAIYASTMVRTQQTATPMSQYLGLPIQVLPGLQEIEAGDYEGTPEKDATKGYLVAPIKWVQGDLSARIPGSIDGNEFESRVTAHCRPFTTTVTATPSCSHTAAPSCSGR